MLPFVWKAGRHIAASNLYLNFSPVIAIRTARYEAPDVPSF